MLNQPVLPRQIQLGYDVVSCLGFVELLTFLHIYPSVKMAYNFPSYNVSTRF